MPTGPLLCVHFPLLKVQTCIPGPLNSFLSSTSFSPWTLLLFYHKYYLGIKLMSEQKCGYFSSLSPSQTNSGRNVLKLSLVKSNSKESNSLWKMILNKKKKKSSMVFAFYSSGHFRVKLPLYNFSFCRSSIWEEVKYPRFNKVRLYCFDLDFLLFLLLWARGHSHGSPVLLRVLYLAFDSKLSSQGSLYDEQL